MPEDETTKKRDQLLRDINEADKVDARLEDRFREELVNVRHHRDVRRAFGEVITTLPSDSLLPDETWRNLSHEAHRHNAFTGEISARLETMPRYSNTIVMGTSTTSSAAVQIVNLATHWPDIVNQDWYERLQPKLTDFNDAVQQSIERERVELLFVKLGLDKDFGQIKSPLTRLQEAYLGLNQANAEIASATSILIPLRDCIEGIVSILLPRRPRQEQSGSLSNKIQSIGKQCGNANFDSQTFLRYGVQASSLHSIFSRAKDKRMLRTEILTHFNAGVTLIRAILTALDPDKFRP